MSIAPKIVGMAAIAALTLSGCTAAQLRGGPASTAEECRVDFEQESRAAQTGVANTSSLGAALATIFVSAVSSAARQDAASQRYRDCLARVGAVGEFSPTALEVRALQQRRPDVPISSCPRGSAVMRGGSQYCVGLK